MAGYSSTGTAKKLMIKPESDLVFFCAPTGWSVEDLPDGVPILRTDDPTSIAAHTPSTVVIAFFRSTAEYAASIAGLAKNIFPDGAIWAAWPRRAGGHVSDITDNTIREHALPLGLVDHKVTAIDEDWSGLRLVWRRELR
jgi:hypothetical protein